MYQGKVKFYNDQKGFGFITGEAGDIFFHIKQCQEGYMPAQDDFVSFDISAGRDGRDSAINVAPMSSTEGGASAEDMSDEDMVD